MTTTCCGGLEAIAEQYPHIFEQPLRLAPTNDRIIVGPWSVRLYKLTPAGNFSKRGGGVLFLNNCPFCGAPLEEAMADHPSPSAVQEIGVVECD